MNISLTTFSSFQEEFVHLSTPPNWPSPSTLFSFSFLLFLVNFYFYFLLLITCSHASFIFFCKFLLFVHTQFWSYLYLPRTLYNKSSQSLLFYYISSFSLCPYILQSVVFVLVSSRVLSYYCIARILIRSIVEHAENIISFIGYFFPIPLSLQNVFCLFLILIKTIYFDLLRGKYIILRFVFNKI